MIQRISFKSLVSFFTTKIYSAKYYKSQCSKDDIYVPHMISTIIHIGFPKTSKGTKEPYDYKDKDGVGRNPLSAIKLYDCLKILVQNTHNKDTHPQ